MGCPCKKHNEPIGLHAHGGTWPTDFCLYCAEKHLSYAACFAREHGHEKDNIGFVSGELGGAELHLAAGPEEAKKLAERIRELRHAVQTSRTAPLDQDFVPLLREVAALIDADIAANQSKSNA